MNQQSIDEIIGKVCGKGHGASMLPQRATLLNQHVFTNLKPLYTLEWLKLGKNRIEQGLAQMWSQWNFATLPMPI